MESYNPCRCAELNLKIDGGIIADKIIQEIP